MGGFSSVTSLETIMFADNCSFDGTKRDGALTTNGQLWIGSTTSPHVKRGTPTINANGNLSLGSGTIGINPYNCAKWIVDPSSNIGTHTNITAALNSANSGDTIFVRPGTYTEDLTLKAGVNITAFTGDGSLNATGHVIIVGKCTFTTAGTVTLSGIQLQTNSDFVLAVTGSAASIVNINDCYLNCTNNTGISITSSGGASVNMVNSKLNLGTTGIAYFAVSAGSLIVRFCDFANSGGSSTASTASGSSVIQLFYCLFLSIITTSNTASLGCVDCYMGFSGSTALTINGTGTNAIEKCIVISGTASAISIGAGAGCQVTTCEISSSNTNAITGAGTINYGAVTFSSSSSTINTTTKNPVAWTTLQGGTGLTSYTTGDILYASATNVLSKLTIGSTGQSLVVASGVPSWGVSPSGGITWSVVTGTTQTAVAGNGYIANNAGQVAITLPATSSVGDTISVTGINNATGWKIAQNAGNQIFFGTSSTTAGTGGSLTSAATRDAVTLVCMTANAVWQVISSIGNITVV